MNDFEKVIGYENIKAELGRLVDVLRNPEKYASLGVPFPSGQLLVGPPGTGKTLLCGEFVKATGRKSFIVRKEHADGEFVDDLRETFNQAIDAAKNEPVIVLCDDMHSWSNTDQRHRNSDEFVALQSLIDKSSGKNVFVLGTANSIDCMPDSLLRAGRLNIIEVNPPKGKDAEKIVEYYLSTKKAVSKDVNVAEVAQIMDGRSCADLEEVISNAGLLAGYHNKSEIEMEDIVKACLRVIYCAPEQVEDDTNPYLYNVAVHEAGHAIGGHLLEHGVNLVSVCRHEGEVEGVTSSDRDEYYFHSMEAMENRIITILCGRAATEIVFGRVDTGANSDLHRAFRIASRFVDDFCALGFDCWEGECMSSSPDLLSRKEQRIYAEMEHYYQRAKKLIIDNRVFLENIAKELVEKKVLLRDDIIRIEKYSKSKE